MADEAELKEMDKRITELTAETSVLQKENSKLDAELTTVSNQLTYEEAKTQLAALDAQVEEGEEMICIVYCVSLRLRASDSVCTCVCVSVRACVSERACVRVFACVCLSV